MSPDRQRARRDERIVAETAALVFALAMLVAAFYALAEIGAWW